jgi:2-polyprenyl-3-methyl-5-hydroxy-6-metoxy-1,4-benzoquinol methylase
MSVTVAGYHSLAHTNLGKSVEKWDPKSHYQDNKVAQDCDKVRFSSLAGRVFNSMERALTVKAVSSVVPSGVIADLPCGTGRLAEPLLEHGFRVIGYGISDDMLGVARGRLARFGEKFSTAIAAHLIQNQMAKSQTPYSARGC